MKNLVIIFFILSGFNVLWSQRVHNIADNDNNIHLKVYGEGEPVLIINGGPGMNSNGFMYLAEKISRSAKAIIYDQRGTGLSKIPRMDSSTVTMDLMIDDIERIRKFMKIEKWVILGHSFGGMLASYYASKHPDRVKGLILSSSGGIDMELFTRIDITSRLSQTQRDSLNYWNSKISRGDTTHFTRLQRGKYLAPAYLYDQSNMPVVAERLTQGNSLINRLVYQNMRKIEFDCAEGLRSLKAPVLIIQGKEDLIDEETAEKAMNVFQNATLVILERCGHYGWLDRPDAYFKSIDNFLMKIKNG